MLPPGGSKASLKMDGSNGSIFKLKAKAGRNPECFGIANVIVYFRLVLLFHDVFVDLPFLEVFSKIVFYLLGDFNLVNMR